MTRLRAQSRGFSLTELLVAMVIGLLLLGGLVALVASSKESYTQQDYNARLQENARFAKQFLTYDLRMAGYYGCYHNDIANDDTVKAVEVGASPNEVTITYAESFDAGNEPFLDPTGHTPGSNTLTLNYVPDSWTTSDALVISDCLRAEVADIDSIDTGSGQVTVSPRNGSFTGTFDPSMTDRGPITVRRLVENTYTIQTGASGIPVLERNGRELVEGVERIRLLYQGGIGTAFAQGDSDTRNPAAVKLGLLVRSVSNENLDDREYGSGAGITEDDGSQHELLDQSSTELNLPTLRGQRRVFTSTLAVRNRPR